MTVREMTRHVCYEDDPFVVVQTESAVPVCERDHCFACGACLACCRDAPCPWTLSGEHDWLDHEERPRPKLRLERGA